MDRKIENFIFAYKSFAACNCLSDDTDGFELLVREDGLLKYQTFTFEGCVIDLAFYKLQPETLEKIKNTMEAHAEIFEVNSQLRNGSMDGTFHQFLFTAAGKEREILALNIENSMDDQRKIRKAYRKAYGETLRQERIVLNLFFEICAILKEEKYELALDHFITPRLSVQRPK